MRPVRGPTGGFQMQREEEGQGQAPGGPGFWAEGLACGQVLRNERDTARHRELGLCPWVGGPPQSTRLHRKDSWSDYDPSKVLGAGGTDFPSSHLLYGGFGPCPCGPQALAPPALSPRLL